MNQQTNQTQHKLNSLIPMEDPDGNRTFVNQWDVKARQEDGWKVVGRIEHHTASVNAPVHLLAGDATAAAGAEKPEKSEKPKKGKGSTGDAGEPAADLTKS